MSTRRCYVSFEDDVVSQDPDESPRRTGSLVLHDASDTATWLVNEKERITLTQPELYALVEALKKLEV